MTAKIHPGYRWLPLRLQYALTSWRALKQAGRTPLILGALRNASLSFVPLPKLDVVCSSPIARSVKCKNEQLLNWPADLGRPFWLPPTVTATVSDHLQLGYRCPATVPTGSRISLCERQFRTPARAQRLVRSAQDVV